MLTLFSPAYGASFCLDSIKKFVEEASFLHQKNERLHLEKPIDALTESLRLEGVKNPQYPINKIAAWLDILDHLHEQDYREKREEMIRFFHDRYVIKQTDISEHYYEARKQRARELGHGEIDPNREQLANDLITDQKDSLSSWTDYLFSKDAAHYPIWARVWALEGVGKLGKWNQETLSFASRRRGTVAPFPELNREALSLVMDLMVKKRKGNTLGVDEASLNLLEKEHFGKLYAHALKQMDSTSPSLDQTDGIWVKYDRGSDHAPLVASLTGKNTGWCTASPSTAKGQLEQGDFYIYYSKDLHGSPTQPRVAIRMKGNQIAELRGVGPDQNLDPMIAKTEIVSQKMKEFGDEGEQYHKKVNHMKKLTLIEHKNKRGEGLSQDELRFLYEIDVPIEGFGYKKDPRIREIIKTRNIKEDIALVTGYKKSEISLNQEEALKGSIKYHYGDLDLRSLTSAEGLNLPDSIGGDLSLRSLTSAKGLNLPDSIGGDLALSSLTSAKGLNLPDSIGGYLDLNFLISAKGLNLPDSIGGDLYLRSLTSAKGLNLLESIGGDLALSSLTSAKGLNLPDSIGGELDLSSLTSAEGLNLPDSIGGSLYLRSLTSAKGLNLPDSIGGSLYFDSLTSAKGLNLPDSIGGSLYFDSLTSAKGLNLPDSIGGSLYFDSLTSAKGLNLPDSIGGSLYLRSLTSAKGLNLPESIGGYLDLSSLTSAKGLNLPESIGGYLDLNFLISAKGLNLPDSIGGYLDLNFLISAKGLNLPDSIGGDLDLRSLTSAKGLNLPESIGGDLALSSLTSAKGLNLPESIGGELDLSSLTSAKGLNLPDSIGGSLYLRSLTSAKGLNLPDSIGGKVYLGSLTPND